MLLWSDFVTCRKIYYNQGDGLYVLEHCRKIKFITYLHLTLSKFFMLSTCHGRVILLCVVQAFIFGVVGTLSKV